MWLFSFVSYSVTCILFLYFLRIPSLYFFHIFIKFLHFSYCFYYAIYLISLHSFYSHHAVLFYNFSLFYLVIPYISSSSYLFSLCPSFTVSARSFSISTASPFSVSSLSSFNIFLLFLSCVFLLVPPHPHILFYFPSPSTFLSVPSSSHFRLLCLASSRFKLSCIFFFQA